MDFTINPDFGQVEADPAAIALDGFQLFFQEQRPFFVENKNIFDYRFSTPIIGGTFSSDNLFYSRRIGRKPQGTLRSESGSYTNVPERTSILGAVKFSGKQRKVYLLAFWRVLLLRNMEKLILSTNRAAIDRTID